MENKTKNSLKTGWWIPTQVAQLIACNTLGQQVAGSINNLANFFSRNYDSHCDRIHFSLKADHPFDDGCIGKHSKLRKVIFREALGKEILGNYG